MHTGPAIQYASAQSVHNPLMPLQSIEQMMHLKFQLAKARATSTQISSVNVPQWSFKLRQIGSLTVH